MDYLDNFNSQTELITKYGRNRGFIIWALSLLWDESDIDMIDEDYVVDCPDDKKIDIFRIDIENKVVYIGQAYISESSKGGGAKANKAADLNTSLAWLQSGEISEFPKTLQNLVTEYRRVIDTEEIDRIELIYLHNRPESREVQRELKTVSESLKQALAGKNINVSFKELGTTEIENEYIRLTANISIRDTIKCPYSEIFEVQSSQWSSVVLTIQAQWLFDLYTRFDDQLFSANYRGFLGVRKKRSINLGIKNTIKDKPSNFWAYNNGITILSNSFSIDKTKKEITLNGVSIINGAQTTGTIGSLERASLSDVKVLSRIIKSNDTELIKEIIKFNNTQNNITSWDKFSNDSIQKNIKEQFEKLGYDYSSKRGFSNINSVLSIENSIQPLIAFIGDHPTANRGKDYIFDTKTLYEKAFKDTKERHILFVVSLMKCIENIRTELKSKKKSETINETETRKLNVLEELKSKYYLLAVLGITIKSQMPSGTPLSEISFTPMFAQKSNYAFDDLVKKTKPFVNTIIGILASYFKNHDYKSAIRTKEIDEDLIVSCETQLEMMKNNEATAKVIEDFTKMICNG